MSTFIIDASVAVRWLVQLPFHTEACALLASANRLLAPDFLNAEVGSALTKLVRAQVLTPKEGREAFEDFFRAPVHLLPTRPVADQAIRAALKSGQGFYDCLYLALAEAEQGRFATADAKFWKAMKGTPQGESIHFIGERSKGN